MIGLILDISIWLTGKMFYIVYYAGHYLLVPMLSKEIPFKITEIEQLKTEISMLNGQLLSIKDKDTLEGDNDDDYVLI